MFWKSKTPWHRSSPETLPPLPPAEALSPPLDSEVQFYLRRASGGCFVLFVLYFFVQAKVPDLLGMLRWLPPRDGIRMLGTEHIMLGCLTFFFPKKRVTFCVISSCLVYLVIYLGVMLACHKACLATVAMLLANCCWRLTKMVSIERLPALADFCQRFIFVTEVFSLQFYTCYILPYVCHILMLFV